MATTRENVQKKETTPKKKFEVDETFIKEAHEAACHDWKVKIEERFPEAFKGGYDFGVTHKLSTSFGGSPIMIANGLAPSGKENKCLVIDPAYKMKVFTHDNRTLLEFVKK